MTLERSAAVLVATSTYPRYVGDTDPNFVHELCRRLVARGFDIDVLAPASPDAPASEEMDGVRIYRYRYFLRGFETLAYDSGIVPKIKARPSRALLIPFLLAGQIVALRKRVRARAYDWVHAHWVLPQGLCAAAALRSGKPRVLVTAHGADLLGLPGPAMRWIKSYPLRRVDRIAAVSSHLRSLAIERFGAAPERVVVAPMGVDFSGRFATPVMQTKDLRLLFVGRLTEVKGVHFLLEAFALLRSTRPTLTLDVVGDGPQRKSLEALAASLGVLDSATFHGALPQERLPEFYAGAIVTVIPSLYEGLGLVAIEALASGSAVVASNLPGIRDIVEHEKTGLLAEVADPENIAQQIGRLLADPQLAARLTRAGQRHVVARFDWERAADRYAELFSQ